MKRLIDWHLRTWKTKKKRKPLLLKGARQIGKTYAVRQLGKEFTSFVEINFELLPAAKSLFEKDLQPERLIWELGLLARTKIEPGKTLLFFDEIQAAPQAVLSLRYFYELMPELHVIAAGSLVEFALEKVGMPVGRINILYVYPLSFIEYLAATHNQQYIEAITQKQTLSDILHNKLMELLEQYVAIGGMPEAVQTWIETKDPKATSDAQKDLNETYRQDFPKYAKRHQLPYLDTLFNHTPLLIGNQFKYTQIQGDYQKRELAPCLDLLHRANVLHQILHTAANGLPLGAEVNLNWFKLILLDIGLTQNLQGLDLNHWFLNQDKDLINRGPIIEAFVGQELLAYSSPRSKNSLYFWKRESSGAQSKIDYVYDFQGKIIPIEVKNGSGTTLRSMHQFLQSHPKSPLGLRFWSKNYEISDAIESRPLYAIASLSHQDQREAISSLV